MARVPPRLRNRVRQILRVPPPPPAIPQANRSQRRRTTSIVKISSKPARADLGADARAHASAVRVREVARALREAARPVRVARERADAAGPQAAQRLDPAADEERAVFILFLSRREQWQR